MSNPIGGGNPRPLTGPLDPSLVPPRTSGTGSLAPDPGKLVLDASKMNAGDSWKSEDRKRAEGKYLAEQALEVKAMRAFFGRLSAKGVAGTGTYQAQFSEGQRRLVASVGSGRTEERAARQAEHDEKRSIAREQVIEDDFEAFQVRHDLAADQAYPSEFLEGPASLAPGGRQAAGKPGASAEGGAGSRPAGEAGAKPGTGAPAVPGTGGGAAVPGTGGRVAVPGTGGGAAVPGTGGGVAVPGTGGGVAVPGAGGPGPAPTRPGGPGVPGDLGAPGRGPGDAAGPAPGEGGETPLPAGEPAERGGAPAPRGRKPGGVRPDPRAGIQPGSGEGLIEGQSGRFRNRVVGGDQGVASEAEAGTGGPGPGGSPEEVAGAPPVDLPDFGPRDPKRPLNPKEAAAVKDGVSRTEAQLEDLADLLSQAGALPRNVGDKPLPGPQRALLKRLANLARRHGLAAEHHLAALETAATPRLTGFLKAGEASALRGAIAALLPALKGRIGHKQAALRQLTGFLGQAALEPKERLAALRVLQSIAGSPAAAPPGPEPAARMLRPVLPQVVADARKVAAPAPPATAAPEAPAAVPAEQAETAEIGLAAARREAVADRQETRRLERARQEERSDLRGADAREEQRRAERKRVLERIAKWQELRQGGKGSAGTPESVAARRFRFLRDIARRQDADSRGGPRARGGRDADRDQQASPRAYLAVLRPVAPERLAALRREAAARRAESAVARSLSGASEREARQLAEREVVDKLETARRRVQEEEGRIVERRRLDIEEQHRLDEARRRDRDETERTAARKRWERDDQERHVQRRRQEREEHEDYLRRRRDREEREREDQRRRDEEELRSRRSLAREQAARQAAGLTSHDGGLGGDVAAEFGVRAPSEQAKQDDIDRISGV